MNSLVVLLVLLCSFVGPSYQILCSRSCSANETFSHCEAGAGECQKTCLTRDRLEDLGCACVAGCICKDGYVKDANSYRCILKEDCPSLPVPKKSCPRNEVYSESGAGCQKNCYTQNLMYKCIPKAGCICRAGYIRSPINNKCILISSCDKCPYDYTNNTETGRCVLRCNECRDPNMEFIQCASSCQPTCEKPFIGICNKMCNAVCVCKPGYIENARGKCILPEECSKPKCPANEILSCRNPTCDDEGCIKLRRKCDDVPCQIKCYCADGFVRVNGTCVPREECNKQCSDPNSTFSSCGTSCEATCDKPNQMICPKICVAGCFCNKGFIKDSTGVCIPIEKCPKPKDCPANEVFDCRHPVCGERGCFVLCRPAPGTPCESRCFCADGYYRENGVCIPEDKCPKEPITCEVNEVFECRNPTCDDEGCFMMGRPCQDVPCQYKCYCAPGLVRIDRKCVPREECKKPVIIVRPIVECIPNAQYTQCGSSCAQLTCDDPTKANVACPYLCEEGCFCMKDYYMNSEGQCVLLKDCTETKVRAIGPLLIGPVPQNLTILMKELQ